MILSLPVSMIFTSTASAMLIELGRSRVDFTRHSRVISLVPIYPWNHKDDGRGWCGAVSTAWWFCPVRVVKKTLRPSGVVVL
jgi:hypothetical protein